ncbi:MAG: endopeptidase La [Tissierellia bacterium]|nr:endopeptidase La [Tissierellia bacterium]
MQDKKIDERFYTPTKSSYPMIAVRKLWVYPDMVSHFDAGRSITKKAIDDAQLKNTKVFLLNQKDILEENPKVDDFYEYGMVATIKQSFNMPNGNVRVLVEGVSRAKVENIDISDGFFKADVTEYIYTENKNVLDSDFEAYRRLVFSDFEEYVNRENEFPTEVLFALSELRDLSKLCDTIVSYLDLSPEENQELLAEFDLKERVYKVHRILEREIELKDIVSQIDKKVQDNINKNQKEYFLREKMNVLKEELAETTGEEVDEIEEYKTKIDNLKIKKENKKPLYKELKRLRAMPEMSPDYGLIRTYLDFVLDMPFNKSSKDTIDLKKASEQLEKEHYGLSDVKTRILESIAIRKRKKNSAGSIICLVGPPGVGKTSIARSIAKALDRKFISMRLGGVTDESEIRGHRKTYVGAMSGRIISQISNIGVKNPVFLLDEIDKLGNDYRGDPASALLEVLDPEQNSEFIDRYLEIPFDLSNVFFITTANDPNTIPDALYDRLEIIEISGYTEKEKLEIAKRYLINKEIENHGLKKEEIQISDAVIESLIRYYTREAGVRNLERLIAKICRRALREILEENKEVIRVTKNNYTKYVGKEVFSDDEFSKQDQVGVVNGLAWTQVGGTILTIEANVMSGKGDVKLTGSLGDVMKESGQAAITYIRSNAQKYGIDRDFYENKDIHVHAPEGAVSKDGPSAGITMTTAIVSALTNRKIRKDIAMTGEVTIRGRVLAIGGLKEKALAAFSYGIRKVIIPKANQKDIEDIPEEIRKKITFIPVEDVGEVIEKTLI